MHSFKSFLLLLLLFICSTAWVQAQTCSVTITPPGPAPVCQPATVTLTASTTSTGVTYQWLEEINGVFTAIPGTNSPTYEAASSGRYQVRITTASCTADSPPVRVTINPIPAQPDFIVNPSNAVCSGSPITFSINGTPPAGETYAWDFGDGTQAIGNTVTHTFKAVGAGSANFEVKVTARSQAGCTSPVRSRFIEVQRKPAFAAPTDSSNFSVCIPDSVKKINIKAYLTNNTPVPNDITQYIVDFGNGSGPQTFTPDQFTSSKAIQNAVAYDTTGAFKITIRAIGANGCDSVYTKDFNINRKPVAEFDAQSGKKRLNMNDCLPVIIAIADTSRGGNLTYRYKVTDNQGRYPAGGVTYIQNTDSTSKEPVLQFSQAGRFNIRLIVSNTCGSDTATQSVLIAFPEVTLFADSTVCGPTTLNFGNSKVQYDANLGSPASYEWTVRGPSGGHEFLPASSKFEAFPDIAFKLPGTYTVSVLFKNECGDSRTFEQQPAEAIITVNPIPANVTFATNNVTICSGDSTTIRPLGPGTTFEFYTQEIGGTSLFSGREFKTGALTVSSTFYVAAKNASDCESAVRRPFTVNVVPELENNTVSLLPNQLEVCAGKPFPGAIAGSAPAGGSGTYTYIWQISQTGNPTDFVAAPTSATNPNNSRNYTPPQPLNQDTYFRRLVGSGNCSPDTSNVVMVKVTPAITGNTIDINGANEETICQGDASSPITGSQPTGTPTIIWLSSTTSGTAGFSEAASSRGMVTFSPGPLNTTTWFRRVLSSGGCSDTSAVVQVIVIPPVTNNTIQGGTQPLCAPNSGPVNLTGSLPAGGGGATNRRIVWEISLTGETSDFTPAPGNNSGQNYTANGLTQTTYFRRTVSVIKGTCTPNSSNVIMVTVVPEITNNSISSTQTNICQGTQAALTGPIAAGGTNDLVYLWESSTTSASAGFNPAAGTNSTPDYTSPQPLTQTTYFRRTVTSRNTNCPPSLSNVVTITVERAPSDPTVASPNVTTCPGNPATLRVTSTTSNTTYEWFTQETGGAPVFVGPEYTTGPLTGNATFFVQTVSNSQCRSVGRTAVTVTVLPVVANAGRDTTIIQGQSVVLRATGGTTYLWSPAKGLSSTNTASPVATPMETTTYTVKVSSANGCEATDEVTITVLPRIDIVNTFSPNRDGINEIWEIKNIEQFPEATVEIYNRYGALVFKSNGYKQAWDGTQNGTPLPLATYYYIIRLKKNDNPYTGSVTIIR